MIVAHGGAGRGRRAPPRAAVRARRRRPACTSSCAARLTRAWRASCRGSQRVIDAPALFSIAYGEIASSIYFALGVVAVYALGFTPAVLLAAGVYFVDRRALVRRGHDGDPRDRRRRDLRPEGVQRPRRLRHRLGALPRLRDRDRAVDAVRPALPRRRVRGRRRCARARGTRSSRCSSIAAIVAYRLAAPLAPVSRRGRGRRRRPRHAGPARGARVRACSTRGTRSRRAPTSAVAPTWHSIAFALPLALLAYTGLETVANLAEETRRPGPDACRGACSPRSGSTVGDLHRDRARRALRVPGREPRERARRRLGARAAHGGRRRARRRSSRPCSATSLRVYVGLTGVLILLTAATTSISGFGRLAYSLGEHDQLPRTFGRLHRRTLVAPQALVAAGAVVGDHARRGRRRCATTRSSRSRRSTASASSSRSAPRSSP